MGTESLTFLGRDDFGSGPVFTSKYPHPAFSIRMPVGAFEFNAASVKSLKPFLRWSFSDSDGWVYLQANSIPGGFFLKETKNKTARFTSKQLAVKILERANVAHIMDAGLHSFKLEQIGTDGIYKVILIDPKK